MSHEIFNSDSLYSGRFNPPRVVETSPNRPEAYLSRIEGEAKSFPQLLQDHSPFRVEAAANPKLPTPMQEAARQGGVLRAAEAKEISAVLDRFQRSQESKWTEMKERLKKNSGANLSAITSRQLEMKMNALNTQFGSLSRDVVKSAIGSADLPAVSFAQSLTLTTEELSKPLATFFNFIAKGERQLYSLHEEIDGAFDSKTNLTNSAVLLKLQVKMSHVSQQLELFTSLLNKSLESTKTVFNTQI